MQAPSKQKSGVQLKVNDFPEFDVAEYLDSDQDIAAFINEFLDDDPAVLAHVLGIAARAKGMTEVAKAAGMSRESLYKALRPGSLPRMDTIVRVLKVFGVRLRAEPISASEKVGKR